MDLFGIAVENVVVGIGAALLVGGVMRAKDVAYNKYLERQYPIAGEYITIWEQEVDGELVTESAAATLTQRGTEIEGVSEMPDSDIEWKFEGQVSETGYLNGIYYSTNPHDTSIGNFFFHINYDGELEGLWSGYQERNDTLNSGRYRFVPVLDAYNIHPVHRSHVPAAVDIAEQRLGPEDASAELLTRALDADDAHFGHVAQIDTGFETETSLGANLTDSLLGEPSITDQTGPGDPVPSDVIGFCVGAVLDQDTFRSSLNVPETELSKALQHADRVGVIEVVAVKDGFEKRGIGTELVERCLAACADNGATALFALGREHDDDVAIAGILEYFGFRAVARIDDYWREERTACLDCEASPCTCTAVLYARYQSPEEIA
ncbi:MULTISPECIES: GNAT family N-acetyltransferase [Haloarcula]|uniref:GNAT family N-acetyltransferase n=1 Tax=Haloarcula TaxID=2237 RepID=UPI0023EE2387|nr:GNAT family N-acetyltransferase [Halomicroarcula sp. XH51]